MRNDSRDGRQTAAVVAAVAAVVALAGTMALPASPADAAARKATIVETTPHGFHLKLKLNGQHGKLRISCPNWTGLGAATFRLHGNKFTAANRSWKFTGKVDGANHFSGHGKTKGAQCGAGVRRTFAESKPRAVVWTACPNNGVLDPMPAGTPFTYRGVLAGAALGTHLRIEYTDPGPAITDVVHVTTDAAGRFSNTHAFPSGGGSEYGASAMARYPDASLATGVACEVFVQ